MEEIKGKKYKILFVCLGNICRSPAAEGIMKKIVSQKGADGLFEIDSAGLYGGHSGEKADKRMRAVGKDRGYDFTSISRQVDAESDFKHFDYVIAMDYDNVSGLKRLTNDSDELQKIDIITNYNVQRNDKYVPDPYYGGTNGFHEVIDILEDCCEGLFRKIMNL